VHDASPWSGESTKLPVTVGCRSAAVTKPACSSGFQSLWSILLNHGKVLRTASRGSRVACSRRYVRYRSQAVENIGRCSIQTSMAEPAHAGLVGLCSRLPKLPGAVNKMAPAHRRPLGPLYLARNFGMDSKKSLHGTGWSFPCRESQEAGLGPPWETRAI
jgi:hypothetical protein